MRIVHLLNWDLKSITEILDDIKRQGFDGIQINPMQPFKTEEEKESEKISELLASDNIQSIQNFINSNPNHEKIKELEEKITLIQKSKE